MSVPAGVLSLGRSLVKWIQDKPLEGSAILKLQTAINTLADNLGASAVGRIPPPPPISSVTVKQSGEMIHISIAHRGEVQQGVHYFSRIANNPAFSQPLVVHHGTSRTSHPISLPTKNDAGVTQSYYVSSFAQYPGSDPTPPVNFGGPEPTPIVMTGLTQMTLLPSTGSGTASANGQQGDWGFGKVQRRDISAYASSGPLSHGTPASGLIYSTAGVLTEVGTVPPSALPTIVTNEVIAGSGTTWTLAHPPGAGIVPIIAVKLAGFGGVLLFEGDTPGFTISGAAITTTGSYSTGSLRALWYQY